MCENDTDVVYAQVCFSYVIC